MFCIIIKLISLELTEDSSRLDIWEDQTVQQRIVGEINDLSNLPEDDDYGDRDNVDYS